MADPVEVRAPRENVNDETVTVSRWVVNDGNQVSVGDLIAEIETSKTNIEIDAPASGFLRHVVREGSDVPVGGILCWISDTPDSPLPTDSDGVPAPINVAQETLTAAPIQFSAAVSSDASPTRFSRGALELIEARGLDKDMFNGRGLVRSSDVLAAVGEVSIGTAPASVARPTTAAPVGATGVPVRKESLSRQKKTEARYLAAGHGNALPSSVTVECTTRGLRELARNHEPLLGNATALVVHEVARLLRLFPRFNAYHDAGTACLYEEVNIGFAVDGPFGLKVPVIHRADTKDPAAIALEMDGLILAYAEDALPVEALAGGTFTITDLSGEDVLVFAPIINQGQSAILGIGAEHYSPGQSLGAFSLTLAFDHQLAAGREAAQFLRELRERLAGHEEALRQITGKHALEPVCSVCYQPMSELHARVYMLQRLRSDGTNEAICSICAQGY